MGTERGLKSMMATTATHFDDGFKRNGFAWVTCGWEMGLVEARKIYGYGGRNGMDGLHLWLSETRKRWPDARLVTQGEFGLLWREHFKNNDALDYRFVHSGSGIRASQEELGIRWFMNRDFHDKLRQGFLAIARRDPERCRVIDASQSVETVAHEVWRHVRDLL